MLAFADQQSQWEKANWHDLFPMVFETLGILHSKFSVEGLISHSASANRLLFDLSNFVWEINSMLKSTFPLSLCWRNRNAPLSTPSQLHTWRECLMVPKHSNKLDIKLTYLGAVFPTWSPALTLGLETAVFFLVVILRIFHKQYTEFGEVHSDKWKLYSIMILCLPFSHRKIEGK